MVQYLSIIGELSLISLSFIAGIIVTGVIMLVAFNVKRAQLAQMQKGADKLLNDAKDSSEEYRLKALEQVEDELHEKRIELEKELNEKRAALAELNHKHKVKELAFKETEDFITRSKVEVGQKERELSKRLDHARSDEVKVKKLYDKLVSRLEQVSNITKEEAKKTLFDVLESETKLESARLIQSIEDNARESAKARATEILVTAMQRNLPLEINMHSTNIIHLPNEEIKGKIIGKEGRNIRALEMATGMEFIITEAPEVMSVSGFNPIRREIAKRTLEKLVEDGRINPTRIEETAAQCEREIDHEIEEYGKQAILEFGLQNVQPEMVTLLGKLHFRTSYSQNVLGHSKEVAYFAKMIAAELGLDQTLASRCGLFHDIGKAVSAEIEGPHAEVGANFAKQYGEDPIVVNAIAAHHEEVPYTSVYGPLTTVTDAMSASRPGARKETKAAYIKRVEQLEKIAQGFAGVKKSFAFQAGREIRVIVDEVSMDDASAAVLARDLAKKIRLEMNFPGQIKVNVIRESRTIEYAR